ncbi:Na+-dependent transporter [Sphingomonas fennica]|uniref:Na+-dependent transporter n=1 Tax=Edaphosphingomonas fennica TaxID=114404 RepID=A0A2T4I6W7_9SPHN|nr:Na+-dependent transporter [Sphingomonas fennica]PTD26363.1 Na+-dependent transporter [Sphingomonas fennica]
MALAHIIPLLINISIFFMVLALGLRAGRGDAIYLLRRPALLLRSIVSMSVVMIAAAILLSFLIDPVPAVKIALIALAMSPVPPILPAKQIKAGGSGAYAVGLLATASVAAVVLTPLAVTLIGRLLGVAVDISASRVATVMLVSVIIPLGIGIGIRTLQPDAAARIAPAMSRAAMILLVVAALPLLFEAGPAIWAMVGDGVLLGLIAFTLIGLVAGHLLGGPDNGNRTVLALATGTRHPGVAIAIATANFPHEKAVLAVVFYHLVISALVSLPYVRRRRAASGETPA